MAALAANTELKTAERGRTAAYKAETDEYYAGALVGIDDSTGYVQPWTDEAGLLFLGYAQERLTGDTTATPIPELKVCIAGDLIRKAAVAGATAVTHTGDLVYCATDNPADLTLTATTNVNAVGWVKRWHSSAVADVQLFTPEEYREQNAGLAIASLTDNSGGSETPDGTISEIADIALSTGNTYTDAAVNSAVNAVVDDVANAIEELAAKVNEIIAAISGGA